ncbi:DNA polymerase I [Podophage Lau218]|uniref:DNA-directed DNA polymerase n=2 Tax=Lauvirus lau218 TaxID=1465639 RepID=A0A060BK49_9CAUD|nr:DNA polymerase I [Podophage Lau218]AIA83131.1 DNA-directed DNA polymerase [Podophage Lau218]AIA83178.1 DNA-directed DNA polymerase [Lauvirus lau218]AIA83227.1 DNA-directed DNA polymerase [Lauvirus lau218]
MDNIKIEEEFAKELKRIEINGWYFDTKKAQQLHLSLMEDMDGNSHLIDQTQTMLDYSYHSKRIRTDYKNFGTYTGRCSHKNPNIAGIPKGKLRGCFGVEEGNALIGTDANQLDATMLAHYLANYDSGDFAKKLDEVDSIHTLNMEILGLERPKAKAFYYAMLYGASDTKLGAMLGGDATLGETTKNNYRKELKGLDNLEFNLKNRFESGYLNNILGQKIEIKNSWTSLNTLLQSASACVMKVFVVLLSEKIRMRDAKIVGFIHDEVQIEVDYKNVNDVVMMIDETWKEVSEYLSLKSTLTGNTVVGRNWEETH